MSERLPGMNDEQLSERLAGLGDHVAWPPTPDVVGAVGAAIRDDRGAPSLVAPRLSLPSRRRTVLVLAAALLAVVGAALAARLVIELGAVTVDVLPGRPTSLPTQVATAGDLGREVGVREAAAIAGYPAALPTALGPPARAWVDEAQVGFEPGDRAMRIVTAWRPSTGLEEIPGTNAGAVLMQFEGDRGVASKQLFAETNHFGEVVVDGREAFWTTGEHELQLVSGTDTQRLLVTGNVLIWQDAGYTFRLESLLGKRDAIRLAETVHPDVDLG
jgi:hypothetical protein